MKKFNLLKWGVLCLFCLLTTFSWAAAGGDTFTYTAEDDVYCTFGSGNAVNASDTGFFNTGAEDSFTTGQGKGIAYITINGTETTCDYYMKLESATQLTITLPASMTITMLFSDENNDGNSVESLDFLLDGTDETVTANGDGNFVYTATLDAGDHIIKRNQTQYFLFYIGLTYVDSGDKTYSEALWDWENDKPTGIQTETAYQGTSSGDKGIISIASTVDGISMYVDVTSGKLNSLDRVSSGDCQMNAGTILRVPVVSEGDAVTVTSDSGDWHNFTIGGVAASSSSETYYATDIDVNRNGYVEIVGTDGSYLKSVSVSYVTSMTAADISEKISSDLSTQIDPTYGEEDDGGIIEVTLDGSTEASYSISAGETAYFSFAIPEYAGTLKVYNTDIDVLYTNADCSEGEVEGNYKYASPNYYEFTGLSTSTTYYAKISATLGAASGTVTADYEATEVNENPVVVTIVSPTADQISSGISADGLTADETFITVTATNMDAYTDDDTTPGLYLKITSTDSEEGNYLTEGWLTEDSNNEGTYTWAPSIAYTLKDGYTYTFTITPKAHNEQSSSDDIGDAVSFDVTGTGTEYSSFTLQSISPSADEGALSSSEDVTFTLTFDGSVKIDEAYISGGAGSETELTATSDDATNGYSQTWNITVSSEILSEIVSNDDANGTLKFIVKAIDGADLYVYSETDEAGYFIFSYTVEKGEDTGSITWSESVSVESIDPLISQSLSSTDKTVTLTFADTDEQAANVSVITDNNAEYHSYAQVGSDEYEITATADEDPSSTWTLTLSDDAITAAESEGMVTIVVVAKDGDGNYVMGLNENNFPTYEYGFTSENNQGGGTVTTYTFVTDPADGTTVDSLYTIVVEIENPADGDQTALNIDQEDIKVYSVVDDVISDEAVAYVVDAEEKADDDDVYTIGYTLTLNTAIKAAGTYIISFPDEAFMCGSLTNLSEAFTSTISVSGLYDNSEVTYSVDPAEDSTLDITEENTIKVTFSGAAKITSAYIPMSGTQGEVTVAATGETTEAGCSTEWTLTISEDVMAQLDANSYFEIYVVAEDESGMSIGAEFFTIGYYTSSKSDASYETWTFSPADGDALESISEISIQTGGPISWNIGDDTYNYDGEANIVVYNEAGDSITTGTGWAEDIEVDNQVVGAVVALADTITAAGSYYFVIPQGLFLEGANYVGDECPEMKVSFTITEEKCLYSTDFTDWTASDGYASSYTNTVTTNYTEEELTFVLAGVKVDPEGYDTSDPIKFEGTGYLMLPKTSQYEGDASIITSALDSITKVVFTEAVTGSNRGYKLSVSTDGGDTWETVFDSTINTGATTQTVDINKADCQLKFENLDTSNNAYLMDLKIYGTMTSSDDDTNAIKSIGATLRTTNDDRFYNLSGQRVSTPTHGIYILNGKKVLIK